MIRKPNNWENVQEYSRRKALPVGAYVCRIERAAVQNNGYGDQLCILFDITDGDYAGYYRNEFKSNPREYMKWKGVLRLFLPTEDGSDRDEISKRTLKGLITAVEKSNYGYTWNWDERTLAGKAIGILMRNEEWEMNGKTGWTARPFRALSVDSVVTGDFTIPNDKPRKKANDGLGWKPAPATTAAAFPADYSVISDDDAELPF